MSRRGPGETLSAGETLGLTYACDTLREATRELTEMGHEEQAAQACLEHAMGLRFLRMTCRSLYCNVFVHTLG